MARLLLILALVAAIVWVYSVVDCAVQPATRHRGVSKGVWVVIVVLLPVVGGLLWFTVGRGRARPVARPSAPDDDPDFLRTLGPSGAPAPRTPISDQEERLRRLEEDLARPDADEPRRPPKPPRSEADGPGRTPGPPAPPPSEPVDPGAVNPAAPRRPGDDDDTGID